MDILLFFLQRTLFCCFTCALWCEQSSEGLARFRLVSQYSHLADHWSIEIDTCHRRLGYLKTQNRMQRNLTIIRITGIFRINHWEGTWISNCIRSSLRNVITRPWHHFNGGLATPSLKLAHGRVITSNSFCPCNYFPVVHGSLEINTRGI